MGAILIGISILVLLSLTGIAAFRFYPGAKRFKKVATYLDMLTEATTNLSIQGYTPEGRIVYWNWASVLSYGYTQKEAQGKSICDLILFGEEKELFLRQLRVICETKKGTSPRQGKVITKSGQIRNIYSFMFPYLVNEKVAAIFCFDLDITDIKNYEQELAMSYAGYKAIFDGVDEAILIYDPVSHALLDVNPKGCELFGYTHEEWMRLTVEDGSFGDRKEITKNLDAVTARVFCDGTQNLEWLAKHKSGKAIEIEARVSKGKINGIDCAVACVRDVTQRKRLEEKVKLALKEKETILNFLKETICFFDKDLQIIWANKAAADMLGKTQNQLTGVACSQVVPHENGSPVCSACPAKAALMSGKIESAEVIVGSANINAFVQAIPVHDEDGRIIGVVEAGEITTEKKLLQQKLRQALNEKEYILNSLQETVCFFDKDLHVGWVNKLGLDLLGKTLEQVRGLTCYEMLPHPEGQPVCRLCRVEATLKTGEVWSGEVVLNLSRGKTVFFVRTYPVRDEQDNIIGVLETAEIITERKMLAEQLRATLREKEIILNNLKEAIAFFDKDLRVQWMNKATLDVLDKTWEQVAVRRCEEVVPLEEVCQMLKTALKTGRLELREVGYADPKITYFLQVIPVRDEANDVVGIIALAENITERKMAQNKLTRTEQQYFNLIDNSNDMIFTVDLNGRFTSINDVCELFLGYSRVEVLGTVSFDYVIPEQREKERKIFEQAISGKITRFSDEITVNHKNGQVLVLNVKFWPEYDEKGMIYGLHGSAADITKHKLALAQMRDTVMQVVSMLSKTVSIADRYTEDHCERLQDFAVKIGEKLNLTGQQLEHLKIAALLHDIGKVGIPIHILIKREKLTAEEWEKIKEHPKKGADIVRQITGFEEVALIIEQHQERVDGTGYPCGLTEDQIKKEAAIISVVDAFDAMTSIRPYRSAMSRQSAVEELRKHSGSQFSSEIVETFIGIILSEPENPA